MKRTINWKEKRIYLLAFLLPVVIMTIAFALVKVYPFGDQSAFIIDGVHQYLGFYEEMIHQLQTGSIFGYSNHALGYSFYSLFTYYLTSPFNLLVLLLQLFMNINEAVTCVILVKIGLIGVCMTWYVKKHTTNPHIALGIGMMYALSNYVVGYYSNLMWFDCVMLLPVLAYFLECLVQKGRWKGYCLVLTYCIFSNYYIGFMLCVFAVCYYLMLCVSVGRKAGILQNQQCDKQHNKKRHNNKMHNKKHHMKQILPAHFRQFAGASLLSGVLNAAILIPSIYYISLTASGREAGLTGILGMNANPVKQIASLFYSAYPVATTDNQGAVNIYCGCVAVLFVILYFWNKGIGRREKIAHAGLLLFYGLGFSVRVLNLLLHGLHQPVSMPNRFSFIFIFLLLSMVAVSWDRMKECTRKQLLCSGLLAEFICLIEWLMLRETLILVTAGIIFVWDVCLLVYTSSKGEQEGKVDRVDQTDRADNLEKTDKWKTSIAFFLTILLITELSSHTILGVRNNGTANRDRYLERESQIHEMLETCTDVADYRTDIVHPMLHNEELLYQLNGISMFSSMNTHDMQVFMERIGCETADNRYQYTGASEVVDMLLGIKYLIRGKGEELPVYYPQIAQSEDLVLYENQRAVACSYQLDETIRDMTLTGENPLDVQDDILEQLGVGKLYHKSKIEPASTSKIMEKSKFEITLKAGEHGYLYLPGEEPLSVKIGNTIYGKSSNNNNFLDLGYAASNQTVEIWADSIVEQAVLGAYQESELDMIYENLMQSLK